MKQKPAPTKKPTPKPRYEGLKDNQTHAWFKAKPGVGGTHALTGKRLVPGLKYFMIHKLGDSAPEVFEAVDKETQKKRLETKAEVKK